MQRSVLQTLEFQLPKPSYTIDTLVYLEEIIRITNLYCWWGDNFDPGQMEEPRKIVEHPIYVYKDRVVQGTVREKPQCALYGRPLLDISATYIRDCLQQGLSIEYLVPDQVYEYLLNNKIYRKTH